MDNTVYRVMVKFYVMNGGRRYVSVPFNVKGARHRMSADACLSDAQNTYYYLLNGGCSCMFSVNVCEYVNQRYSRTLYTLTV